MPNHGRAVDGKPPSSAPPFLESTAFFVGVIRKNRAPAPTKEGMPVPAPSSIVRFISTYCLFNTSKSYMTLDPLQTRCAHNVAKSGGRRT
jgi:hypothetical protein